MPLSKTSHNPSKTALLTAFFRTIGNMEYGNERIGSDNMAMHFLPFYLRALVKSDRMREKALAKYSAPMPGVYEYVLARTAFFDDIYSSALNDSFTQIVFLGAGYDSRPYRFAGRKQGARIIEVDGAPTQRRKLQCLKKAKVAIPAAVTFAAMDFNQDSLADVLRSAGYLSEERTLFIWEGVSMYLEPRSVDEVLEFVATTANKDSLIAFDFALEIPPASIDDFYGARELTRTLAKSTSNEPFKLYFAEEYAEAFFAKRGLKLIRDVGQRQIEADYLKTNTGHPIGKSNGMFRLALASPA